MSSQGPRVAVIGLDCGEGETEAFWRDFLRGLVKRGLAGVQLVVSDAHEGLKNAIGQVLGCREPSTPRRTPRNGGARRPAGQRGLSMRQASVEPGSR